MAGENRKRLEALPIFLQPRLRLFLSVDLVGSTASKQRPAFPIREPGRLWADGEMAPPWLSPIANFFGSFQEAFVREWRQFKNQIAPKLGIEVTIDPTFWKANGDELIFVKELVDRKEVLGCIDAWLKALKVVRKQLISEGLDVKATAWTAGFPVTNSEFVFQSGSVLSAAPFEDDPRLQQFSLLEQWHQDDPKTKNLVMDFIGPSVDIGFRLTSRATPRHFVISVDIAYLLSAIPFHTDDDIEIEDPVIFYGGRTELKGVLGGRPYPVFWIDAASKERFDQAEDALLKASPAQKSDIERFCLEFYRRNSTLMLLPFIFKEDVGNDHKKFPDNYIEALEHLRDKWEAEKQRYLDETEIESVSEDVSENLSEAESEKVKREIISAVKEQKVSQSSAKVEST